jgi:hypothetical protein
MNELRECKKRDPITGRKCGLYVPHPMPHKLLRVDRVIDKAGYERVEWGSGYRWVVKGRKRPHLQRLGDE